MASKAVNVSLLFILASTIDESISQGLQHQNEQDDQHEDHGDGRGQPAFWLTNPVSYM